MVHFLIQGVLHEHKDLSGWNICRHVVNHVIQCDSQTHDGHSSGMKHESETTTLPVETGQSAFAAIAEIVALLGKKP